MIWRCVLCEDAQLETRMMSNQWDQFIQTESPYKDYTKYESRSTILRCQSFLLQHVLQQFHINKTRSLSASRSTGATLVFLLHLWLSSTVTQATVIHPLQKSAQHVQSVVNCVLERQWRNRSVVAGLLTVTTLNFKGSNAWANYVFHHHAEYKSNKKTSG